MLSRLTGEYERTTVSHTHGKGHRSRSVQTRPQRVYDAACHGAVRCC